VHQIYGMMQSGKKFGMQTLNDSLMQLHQANLVTEEDCLRVSPDGNEFLRMIGRAGADEPHGGGAGPRPRS